MNSSKKSLTTTDLLKILFPTTPLGKIPLKEEDRECVNFANFLRELSLRKDNGLTFPYAWLHVPNQFALHATFDGKKKIWKTSPAFGKKQSWMGRIPGIPDYLFLNGINSFGIEFKSEKGKLSECQKICISWFESKGIHVYICRSSQEAQKVIEDKINELY